MLEFKDSDHPEMGSRIFFGFSGVFSEVDAGIMCYVDTSAMPLSPMTLF